MMINSAEKDKILLNCFSFRKRRGHIIPYVAHLSIKSCVFTFEKARKPGRLIRASAKHSRDRATESVSHHLPKIPSITCNQ